MGVLTGHIKNIFLARRFLDKKINDMRREVTVQRLVILSNRKFSDIILIITEYF